MAHSLISALCAAVFRVCRVGPAKHLGRIGLLVCCLGLLAGGAPVSAAGPSLVVAQGDLLADASGQPLFVLGASYEGPPDRAWSMWDDGRFDAALIAQDLDRAKAANLLVVRVFVQQALAADIQAGRWDKLDQLLALADQRGLRVILTLADYPASDVSRLAATAAHVAAHSTGRATLLALDLKNEPHFGDLALATYPPQVNAALQDPGVVPAIGEMVARQELADYRASAEGQRSVPERLTEDRAYVYANVLLAYRRFLQDGQAWAAAHHATLVDYARSPESDRWNALKAALNDTLTAWLKPQLDAVRAADPHRLVTLAQVDPILASLPVNAWLDYRTFHRYPAASPAGVAASMQLFDAEKAAIPGKPLVLGEFGVANDTTSEEESAALEVGTVRAVRDHGGAGALKWMLNDVPNGGNARQDAFGMYRGDGTAKPVVAAFRALGTLTPLANIPTPAITHDARYFAQTGYRVDSDAVWGFVQSRGGVAIFGYPVSRTITLLGCPSQLFQRHVVQVCETGRPSLLNLLDPDVFPYTRVNGSTFPAPDSAMKNATPRVDDSSYAAKIVEFVRASVPDNSGGQAVGFQGYFFGTITAQLAGTADPGVLPLLDLEVWGAPISRPTTDPLNADFIYQRFQRGIMHYTASRHTTESILLADYLKQMLRDSPEEPDDLRQQARGSRFSAEYCPGRPGWLCRPNDLPNSDLTFAFEPG